MKVTVVGTGYVGLSLSVLISRKHEVVAVDIVASKVELINKRQSPIKDAEIERYLSGVQLNLHATTDIAESVGSDYVIIATPTNYDPEANYFDTRSVESVVNRVKAISPDSIIVIKSTIPIGYTEKLHKEQKVSNILYSPEFLREGKALYDNLHPSRIIVGVPSSSTLISAAKKFADLLSECAEDENINILIMGSTEAESVKLFSNTFLAMRVAFFNELDTFAEYNGLNSKEIIGGMCLDSRIGNYYNNPSFGYGGYCLPKDTKQLLANYQNIPQSLIGAIVQSNAYRKKHVVDAIKRKIGLTGTVGVYRLIMKSGSDNFRESSVFDIMSQLNEEGYTIVIYEPLLTEDYLGYKVETDFNIFKKQSDIILANRKTEELNSVSTKVYCRDIFNRD